MDEIVDIVDQNDNVIGRELKLKCHHDGIFHRGAGVICFKDASYSEILLTKRSLTKRSMPNCLCLPGGHLALGESYEQGARREFLEEVCVGMQPEIKLELLLKIKKNTDDDCEFFSLFGLVYPGPFSVDRNEVDEAYFEKVDLVMKKISSEPEKFTGTTILMLKKYFDKFLK